MLDGQTKGYMWFAVTVNLRSCLSLDDENFSGKYFHLVRGCLLYNVHRCELSNGFRNQDV